MLLLLTVTNTSMAYWRALTFAFDISSQESHKEEGVNQDTEIGPLVTTTSADFFLKKNPRNYS